MPRNVYLLVFNSPLFPAHWSLWVPSTENPKVGKRLHATGDAASGFQIAFERNFNLDRDTRTHQIILLAQAEDQHVVDVSEDGGERMDNTAYDTLEEVALQVRAPGPSLASSSSLPPKQRIRIENCQTWLRAVVVALVQNSIFEKSALQIVDNAPKN
ncbi:hypothetical protein GQ44DRAFT_709032 [Phaeosphaeriaceae sp. PMI808]|nr:hypothetical protein GQ44DRAFT_709032 [Phaeosphaeriaceae sp. PMI808]